MHVSSKSLIYPYKHHCRISRFNLMTEVTSINIELLKAKLEFAWFHQFKARGSLGIIFLVLTQKSSNRENCSSTGPLSRVPYCVSSYLQNSPKLSKKKLIWIIYKK